MELAETVNSPQEEKIMVMVQVAEEEEAAPRRRAEIDRLSTLLGLKSRSLTVQTHLWRTRMC